MKAYWEVTNVLNEAVLNGGVLVKADNVEAYLLNDFADIDRDFLAVDFDEIVERDGEKLIAIYVYN